MDCHMSPSRVNPINLSRAQPWLCDSIYAGFSGWEGTSGGRPARCSCTVGGRQLVSAACPVHRPSMRLMN